MNTFEQPKRSHSFFSLWAIAVFFLILLLGHAEQASGQTQPWSTAGNGTDIYNTNSGKVGIGTSTPGGQLEINKSQNASTALVLDNGYSTVGNQAFSGVWFRQGAANRFFLGSINDGNNVQVGGPGAVQFWNFANGPMLFSTNNTERLRINGSGNVGIGTTAPTAKLEVSGTPATSGNLVKFSGADLNGNLFNEIATTGQGGAMLRLTGGGGTSFGIQSTGVYSGPGNNKLIIGTPSTVLFTLNSDGNTGIGTTSPSSKLDVAGQIRSSAGGFVFPDGTVQTTAATGASGGGSQWSAPSSNVVYTTGNVGIGSPSPNEKLVVLGSNIRPIIGDSATHTALYSTNNAQNHNTLEIYSNGGISSGLVLTNNVASGATGQIIFANKAAGVEGTNDLRLGTIASFTDGAANSGYINFYTTNAGAFTEKMRITKDGNVGIGTTAPAVQFHVQGPSTTTARIEATNTAAAAIDFKNPSRRWVIGTGLLTGGGDFSVYDGNAAVTRMYINTVGNVGIGTTNPTKALHVVGDIEVTGNINAKYQDVAEWVPATRALPAGTVVVLNPTQSNQVMASEKPYDTRVAGVISGRPGIALGEAGADKVLVATTGRVKVKVDASRSAIRVGDLLVTSDREGVAMKSEPLMIQGRPFHSPGTLIGKALEPLESGVGEILVLLSLQ